MIRSLIGITGLKGSGKDTAAAALDGYENVKMAGPLKTMLLALLEYQGAPFEEACALLEEPDLKEQPSPWLAGQTPRHAMQHLGTAWGRDKMDPEFWVLMAERRLHETHRAVVTDVRFPNEAAMIKRLGGTMLRIERPGLIAGAHPSESMVGSLPVDLVILNDFPTAEGFQARVRDVLMGAR